MSLSEIEQKELLTLMDKLEFPLPSAVFEAWCRVFGNVCAEIAVMRTSNGVHEMLLTYRDDEYFKGWHIPGSIMLPGETIEDTRDRVMRVELSIEPVVSTFIHWFQRMYGTGIGESTRGYELAFLFSIDSSRVKDFPMNEKAKFFALDHMPSDLIPNHVRIVDYLKDRSE